MSSYSPLTSRPNEETKSTQKYNKHNTQKTYNLKQIICKQCSSAQLTDNITHYCYNNNKLHRQ